jgi:alpha-beta hydrolase superfamily lysophospholipase
MKTSEFRLPAKDGTPLFVRAFLPDQQPKALVQIVHGMAEHSARYARPARALTEHGYAVYADDHRGHGKTATRREELGHFADEGGWELVVGDQLGLLEELKSRHPDLPVFLFGHSLGSYIARAAAIRASSAWAGLILSGTSHDFPFRYHPYRVCAWIESVRLGKRGKSPLLRTLSFESFNAKFEDPRTTADWLSRDEAEVDKYVADPLCGFESSAQLWHDVFSGLIEICSPRNIAKLPHDLPIYIMAGALDPLNGRLSAIRKLHHALEAAGMADVTVRAYEGARHELFNETNRDEVTRELIEWLDQRLAQALPA